MVNSAVIHINGIGPILLERSSLARHISISIRPFKGVRVAVPARVSFTKAAEFAHARTDWIRRHLGRMRQYESASETIQDAFVAIDANKAKARLTRLKQLAEKHGFTYSKVFIRNQKTRWGSCSHKNDISLNIKLVCLPNDLVDYVILHELVHTRKKSHGKGFWAMLDRYMGNAKDFASRLNRTRVYAFEKQSLILGKRNDVTAVDYRQFRA